jgi:hypothetical protein
MKKPDSNKRSASSVVRDFTDATIYDFLSSLNTARSLTVWLLYSSGEHDQLLQLECNPELYLGADSFRDDYAATSLLSKADFLESSYNREERALDKFLKSEEQCRVTNDRLWPYSTSDYMPLEELHPLLPRVRSKIRAILGRFDPEEFVDSSDWGPGVTTLLKGSYSVKPNKYQQETGMTLEVHNVIWPLLKLAYPSWWKELLSKGEPTIELGNVITTVPKNSKTDRVIAVEPGLNLWFQKGIGEMIRRRLLRRGCNLNDQSINQLASKRARDEGLATIDFSSASDTIAFEAVRLLLPPSWFEPLRLLRCKRGKLRNGHLLTWKKFSSMGNGYTFELESLIFFSVALVVVEHLGLDRRTVSVYGDDVILPQAAYPLYRELVHLLGFQINLEKSFSQGEFFESCGAHWFSGFDVKPVYLKRRVKRASDCYSIHNRMVEYASRCIGPNFGLDSRFRRACRNVRACVSRSDFLLVPRHLGDSGFFSNLDHALTLRTTRYKRMMGYEILKSSEVPQSVHFDGYGLILDRLRSMSKSSEVRLNGRRNIDGNLVPLKSSVTRKLSRTVIGTGQWYDWGPWL